MASGLDLLASGFQGIEGPVVDGLGGLYFSDSVGGGVYHLGKDGTIDTVIPKRKGVGGIVLHADGGIVVSGRDLSHVQESGTRVLATREDVPSQPGTRVGGFNDITADHLGRIFAGCTRFDEQGGPVPGELLMVEGPQKLSVVYGDVGMTNGIAQSADGARLFHADTDRRRIIVSDIPEGGLPLPVAEYTSEIEGRPDGVAADVEGGLWVAWGSAVLRFDSDGRVERSIAVPSDHTLNCCFGGDQMTDLYIVTMGNTEDPALGACIYRTSVGVSGSAVATARV